MDDSIIESWIEEAQEEVNKAGWREAPINALLLMCHGLNTRNSRRLYNLLKAPLRWFVGVVATGLLWWIIATLFGLT